MVYEREPGFFLGSIYVNYGVTAVLMTMSYLVLRIGFDIRAKWLLYAFLPFVFLFPVFFFRYARAIWLAMDCYYDPRRREEFPDEAEP